MIYLALHNDNQVLTVPRADGISIAEGAMSLILRKGGKEIVLDGLEDLAVNKLYFLFQLQDVASRLVTGEYDYELQDADGETAGIGILTVGDYVREFKDVPGEHTIVEYDG